MRILIHLLLIAWVANPNTGISSSPPNDNSETYQISIGWTEESIIIDGLLNEDSWQTTDPATDFWTNFPTDQERASKQTEVRVAFNHQYLYVAAICYDDPEYIVSTLKRDQSFEGSDVFAIFIDPLNQRTNGFGFGVNVMGSQSDALFSPGDADTNWDGKWYSAAVRGPESWTVEMAIPFKSLRYEEGQSSWGVNFYRGDPGTNQNSLWAKVPQQFNIFDLGYYGSLQWETPPPQTGANMAIVPYARAGIVQDFSEQPPTTYPLGAGGDLKVGIGSSLNLDLTINPDFSQVEVDRQVTNLTRFNIFFPERRTFFLENADIFSSYGIPPIRPFFSRRIGLDDEGQPIPINLGLRLTGNLDPKTRIGIMDIQTGTNDNTSYRQNYGVISIQRQLFARSVLKGYFHNRQGFTGDQQNSPDYGRNAGLEFNYSNSEGSLGAWASGHYGFTPERYKKNHFYNWGVYFAEREWNGFADFAAVGENYLTDFGFVGRLDNYDAERDTVIRLGFNQTFAELNYNYYPENNKKINRHLFHIENYLVYNPDWSFNERSTRFAYFLQFANTSEIEIVLRNFAVALPFPISFTEGDPLPAASYGYNNFSLGYSSDVRKVFSVNANVEYGTFYNGTAATYRLGFLARTQPWGNFGLDFNLSTLTLPEEYGEAEFFLISPRVEINFSENLFWTTFLQYNTQAKNFNINSRLQWRYAPMSDLFIVYTDNYVVDSFFAPKTRALVVKMNYWFTI